MGKTRRIGRQEQLLQGRIALIDALYAAATDPEGWPAVARVLGANFDGIPAIIHRKGTPRRTAHFLAHEIEPFFAQSYAAHFVSLNPWELSTQGAGRPAILVNDGHLPPEIIDKSEFGADWLRPQGDLRYQIDGAVWLSPTETVEMVVARSRRRGPIDEAEAGMLAQVLPHLQRAVDLSQRLALAEAGRQALSGMAQPLGAGALLVDGDRRVLSLDSEAERILQQGGGLSLRQGRLRAEGRLDERLGRAIAQATGEGRVASGRTGDLLVVPRGAMQVPLSVAIGPLDDRQRPLGLLGGPFAMVVVSAPERSLALSEDGLRALFDLTPAEARLVIGLCAGQTLAEYASGSGTSLNTIKTHLKRVFDKSGEARQADLVRRVMGDVALRFGSTLRE